MSINFFTENVALPVDNNQRLIKWITAVISDRNFKTGTINYIFCDDEYLLALNKQYLDHDTYTDIITFDYSKEGIVSGDIFISVDRVADNAKKYKQAFERELHRVIIHGVLHLCGLKDKTEEESAHMRSQEDYYLTELVDYFQH